MPVLAVTSNLFQTNKKQNSPTNYINNTPITNDYKQSNNLFDINHSYFLTKKNNISFRGNQSEMLIDLTKKVSVAFNSLKDDHLLVVGNDIERTREVLKKHVKKIKTIITKVLFVQDTKFKSTIAIKKNVDGGFDELMNLEDVAVFFKRLGEPDSVAPKLKEGEKTRIMFSDYICTGHPEYGFYIDSHDPTAIDDLPKDVIQKFDLSGMKNKGIAEINAKNIDVLRDVNVSVNPVKSITFADVAGQDLAIAEIKSKILYPLKYPNFFINNQIGNIHSAMFIGSPGNGKSLAAQALANEAGVPFYNMNGQLLEGMYIGESAHNIHKYYEEARKNQPCIIFFDEADAIFGKRRGVHQYADQSVNVHLDELSQLEKENAQVFVIAATNHPELIDEGALRNGRFATKIEFKNPDTIEKCRNILGVHTRLTAIDGLDRDAFSASLLDANFSGADIAAVVAEAKMLSTARQGIFDAMAKGTFIDDPEFRLTIIGKDFNAAFDSINSQKKILAEYEKQGKADRTKGIREEIEVRMQVERELREGEGEGQSKKKIGFERPSI